MLFPVDSANSAKLTIGMRLQLSSLYGKPHEDLTVVQWRTQQQKIKLGNCGLFAIANMLDFCMTDRVGAAQVDFEESMMRPHLIKCFEQKKLTPFPTIIKNSPLLFMKKENSPYHSHIM